MKFVRVSRAGGPEVLELLELPKPKLKDGWYLIKIQGLELSKRQQQKI